MAWAFIKSWTGFLFLAVELVRAVPAGSVRISCRRALIFAAAWFGFGVLNGLHWIGFLLDELLFPGYRRVRVARPISIVGVPRSGTTFLQRTLARDRGFTTLTLFECVIAPSITERYFWSGLRRVLGRLVPDGGLHLTRMASIHEIGLDKPEEDFLLLLWIHMCFLAAIPMPANESFWRLTRFDRDLSPSLRRRCLDFHHRCMQKHLYYHGEDKRLLSKNPSFTPMLRSLRARYPDASIIACVRPPLETVPSQLSSLAPAFDLLGQPDGPPEAFALRMVDVLRQYYADISEFAAEDSLLVVEMARLNSDLENAVAEIADFAGYEPSQEFRALLPSLATGGRQYQSRHDYTVESCGLTVDGIEHSFSEVWPLSLASSQAQDTG